jgi:hypothetical protein
MSLVTGAQLLAAGFKKQRLLIFGLVPTRWQPFTRIWKWLVEQAKRKCLNKKHPKSQRLRMFAFTPAF